MHNSCCACGSQLLCTNYYPVYYFLITFLETFLPFGKLNLLDNHTLSMSTDALTRQIVGYDIRLSEGIGCTISDTVPVSAFLIFTLPRITAAQPEDMVK